MFGAADPSFVEWAPGWAIILRVPAGQLSIYDIHRDQRLGFRQQARCKGSTVLVRTWADCAKLSQYFPEVIGFVELR